MVATGFLVRIPRDAPLRFGAPVSCAVMTGWGAVNRAGELHAGEAVVVFGAGGIGINAVMGAARGEASAVISVDPLENKRALALELGATHAFASAEEAQQAAADLNPTAGGADLVVVAAGTLDANVVRAAFDVAGTRGRIVVVAMTEGNDELRVPGMTLIGREKRLVGSQYGSCDPSVDIPMLVDLAMRGELPLDRLITALYPLDDIIEGYADLAAGRNIRGVIEHASID